MTPNQHITPELFQFFRELKVNNNREWFQANKNRYQTQVLEPLLQFISDFGLRLPDQEIEFGTGEAQQTRCLEALALYRLPDRR